MSQGTALAVPIATLEELARPREREEEALKETDLNQGPMAMTNESRSDGISIAQHVSAGFVAGYERVAKRRHQNSERCNPKSGWSRASALHKGAPKDSVIPSGARMILNRVRYETDPRQPEARSAEALSEVEGAQPRDLGFASLTTDDRLLTGADRFLAKNPHLSRYYLPYLLRP